jgi:hypothetical protein
VYRDSSSVGVQAWAFVVLQLEQLDEMHPFAGRRDVVQCAVAVGEHDACFGRVEELDAAFREPVQELDDVVFVNKCIGELYERCEQVLFSGHEAAFSVESGFECTDVSLGPSVEA